MLNAAWESMRPVNGIRVFALRGAFLGALGILDVLVTRQSIPIRRVLALRPPEGVFAYARISPAGDLLAYASEDHDSVHHKVTETVTIVDLKSRSKIFAEPGVDAYWSPDGARVIYRSMRGVRDDVAIWQRATGRVQRNVAPTRLGDYYSWGRRNGRDVILTITGNYFFLRGDSAVLPESRIPNCPKIGVGERPLMSKDGRRVTVFIGGRLVVRDLADCRNIIDTGVEGAKADFSWDGRFIAFHAPKARGQGYEIHIIDLSLRTIRTLGLTGSSLFPSWTRDGRLCFRYDGDDYRGFVVASDVFSLPARPLGSPSKELSSVRQWAEIFPETKLPRTALTVVMIWGPLSAHSPEALRDLQQVRDFLGRTSTDVAILSAAEPSARAADIDRLISDHGISLMRIPLSPRGFVITEAINQIPTILMFGRDGALVDRRLGAVRRRELLDWIRRHQMRQ